jgi:hypothetical protein
MGFEPRPKDSFKSSEISILEKKMAYNARKLFSLSDSLLTTVFNIDTDKPSIAAISTRVTM